ncbi:MAG TPA: hypothetical protein VD993_18525 [Chitinophagaceae bacterium]|nr:hypothetical protein [Chitinophagaceae bacterium]
MQEFGEEKILSVRTLLPIQQDFPFRFDGSEGTAYSALNIVANQMEVNPTDIVINFFDERFLEIRGDTGQVIFTQPYEDELYAAGLYHGKNEQGKFEIDVERGQLTVPEHLVSTLAHEIAHIKILGEERLSDNDELLTDLVTVFFGLGIFNANAAFRFFSAADKWGYSKQGYLTQQEWGYALAIYAYIRGEKGPEWSKYLTPGVKSDYKKSEAFIYNNTDKILV